MTDPANIPQPPPQRRRRVSPLFMILTGALGAAGLFAVFAVISVSMQDEAPVSTGLQSVKMPDGTLRVLEDVTYGTHHEFEVEVPPQGFSFFPQKNTKVIDDETPENRIMLWFSHRKEKTGQHLGFDWWLRCVAIDEHGCEIEDEHPGIDLLGPSSGSRRTGVRPFITSSIGVRYPRTVAHSALRPFRHAADTFTLRVYDVKNEVVAEFEVPDRYPDKGHAPVWEPQPLPLTVSDGNVALRVESVSAEVINRRINDRLQECVRVDFSNDVLVDGEPTPGWSIHNPILSDALGNMSSAYVCTLDPHESAWKVDLQLFRTAAATFDPSEMWAGPTLEIPARDTGEFLSQTGAVDGVSIAVSALGGPGSTTYTAPTRGSGSYSGRSSYGGRAGEEQFKISSLSSIAPGRSTVTTNVECELPHVAAHFEGLSPGQQASLQVRDDQQRDARTYGPFQFNGDTFWFLDLADDAKSIELTFAVHRGRSLSFFIAPPEFKRPEKQNSEP